MKPFRKCLTDAGKERDQNEDAYFEPSEFDSDILERNGYLFAVADGMGGHEGGALASRIAVQALGEFYNVRFDPECDEAQWKQRASEVLKTLISRINHYVFGARYSGEEIPSDMGTTLAGVLTHKGTALAFNVGDSRVYHLSTEAGFKQITKDHSKTQALVDQGLITEEGARTHPEHNVVTRSLGLGLDKGRIEPDIFPFSLSMGDQILICSDGLSNMVEDAFLGRVMITNGSDLEGNTNKMMDEALRRGGYDNITLILIQMGEEEIDHGQDTT